MDETKATAHLPNMDIEITHRQAPDGRGETVSVSITAVPSLDAMAGFLGNNLMSRGLPQYPATGGAAFGPMAFLGPWMQMMEAAWAPWRQLAEAATQSTAGFPPPSICGAGPASKDKI